MKLYYSKGACSLAVRIAIHEMGIKCDYEAVDLQTKKTEKGNDFLKINPKGSVPTLELDNKEILTENAVIQQYLADQFHGEQVLPPLGNFLRYRVLEWLNYISTELHKGVGPLFSDMPKEIKEKYILPLINKRFDFLNNYLSNHQFLVNEQFSLADGYLFVILFWFPHLGLELAKWPNLENYFVRIKKRKAVHEALTEEGFKA